MADSLLDPEFLARLEYLHLVTKDLFRGQFAAERVSKKFGVGQEFADFRSYVPGDDFRHIDWATYARRDALVVKLFSEEQEMPVYIAVDASNSMSCGAPEKLLYAKKLAAALGYIALANLDPVELVIFDAGMRPETPGFSGRGQLAQMLGFLEATEARGRTDLAQTFRRFVQHNTRRGVVVLISDFLDHAGYEEALRLVHYHRFDLLAIQVNSRDEVEPNLESDVELHDSETGEKMVVKLTPTLLEEYKQRFEEHYVDLRRLCRVLQRSHIAVVTDQPFEQLVLEVFRTSGFLR
jgi:uncharacterized protein (DUF58 family)